MVQMGKVYGNLMVDVQVTNKKLAGRARRILMELIDVDDSTAAELLAASGNSVKVAVVMHECDVSRARAVQLLADANGHLRRVLSSDTNTANGA
jgi:N-acetylmuramic acid 6-phosphate etherase